MGKVNLRKKILHYTIKGKKYLRKKKFTKSQLDKMSLSTFIYILKNKTKYDAVSVLGTGELMVRKDKKLVKVT